jgi:hypothetical protein
LYLDFGGALAAIGLVFAVYQLRQPSWDVVLALRPRWQRDLFLILAASGFVFTLLAVMFEKMRPCWQPHWLVESFPYQMLAYVAFAASPTSLWLFATWQRGLFSERNAKRFYTVLAWRAAMSAERSAVLQVLLMNFHVICRFAVDSKPSKSRAYARAVLDVILSDEEIVRELTTKQLAGLQHVFGCANEYGLSQLISPTGIPALVRGLFTDPQSFLYKQYRADGLAQAMNIYETIFGSSTLLKNFELFNYPSIDYSSRDVVGSRGLDVFIEALKRSITTYLATGRVPADHVKDGIKYLSDVFGDHCLKASLDRKHEEAHPRTPAWDAISRITHFFGHDYGFILDPKDWNEGVRRFEFATTKASFLPQYSISAGVAEAICTALSQLACIDKNTDIMWSYTTVVDLLHGLMYQRETSDAYRTAFDEAIWQKIYENVVRRFYPARLRVYLEFIGFLLVFKDTRHDIWAEEQRERMRRLLYVDLKPLFEQGKKMINDEAMESALLPKVMRYAGGKFYYTARYGEGEEAEIEEPPAGSTSALEGVKDQYRQ